MNYIVRHVYKMLFSCLQWETSLNTHPSKSCLVSLNVFLKSVSHVCINAYVHLHKCVIYQDNHLSTKQLHETSRRFQLGLLESPCDCPKEMELKRDKIDDRLSGLHCP